MPSSCFVVSSALSIFNHSSDMFKMRSTNIYQSAILNKASDPEISLYWNPTVVMGDSPFYFPYFSMEPYQNILMPLETLQSPRLA